MNEEMNKKNKLFGYQLDCLIRDIKEVDILRFEACADIVDEKITIRKAAGAYQIPKSTLHWYIHNKLKGQSYELYKCVCKQLNMNWNNKFLRRNT